MYLLNWVHTENGKRERERSHTHTHTHKLSCHHFKCASNSVICTYNPLRNTISISKKHLMEAFCSIYFISHLTEKCWSYHYLFVTDNWVVDTLMDLWNVAVSVENENENENRMDPKIHRYNFFTIVIVVFLLCDDTYIYRHDNLLKKKNFRCKMKIL